MKITESDYQKLTAMLEGAAKNTTRLMSEWAERYEANGLSAKRFRWDWLYMTSLSERQDFFDTVYQYADDTHVDTALRKAVAALLEEAA